MADMVDGERGCETDGALIDCLFDHVPHRGEFVVGGCFPLPGFIAHDGGTDCGMTYKDRDVRIGTDTVERCHILGEAFTASRYRHGARRGPYLQRRKGSS